MAAGGSDTGASIRHAGSTAHERGPAGPVVAFCRGDRCVGSRGGVAPARGLVLMGGARWERVGRWCGGGHRRRGGAGGIRVWADRLGVPCSTGTKGPAAVVFDAIAAARARGGGIDTVLVDTAGRLHTEERLLEELKKVVRVAARQQPGAPHESFLVLDATVGQNAVHQARAFAAAVPLTGLIVTKLDGTAKGGSVVALERAVQVPIRFLGTGEGLGDLEVFAAERFARRLIGG